MDLVNIVGVEVYRGEEGRYPDKQSVMNSSYYVQEKSEKLYACEKRPHYLPITQSVVVHNVIPPLYPEGGYAHCVPFCVQKGI